MIQIIPSIAIHEGKVVRLRQGDYDSEIVYDENPIDLARKFEDHGIEVVHLVDLDGAKRGDPVNYHILEAIANYTSLKVDFTGGIHTDGALNKALEHGASYITAASVAVNSRKLFASWLVSYSREKITLGADTWETRISYRGWKRVSAINVFDHIQFFYDRGLKYVKSTDIKRDGEMQGPGFDLYKDLLERFPGICVLASGGIRNIDDIKKLNDMGIFAVIIGRALYEERITLKDLEQFLVKSA